MKILEFYIVVKLPKNAKEKIIINNKALRI